MDAMAKLSDLLGASARAFLERRHLMLIDGQWIAVQDGRRFDVINPADETVIVTVPAAGAADGDWAVEAARRALEHGPWPQLRPATATAS